MEGRNITNFVKIYGNNNKYNGKAYDILDDKLRLFLDIYYYLQVLKSQFSVLLLQILTGQAEQYYIHYTKHSDTFANSYHKLKTHFDTEVNHKHYYTDWTTTTFEKVRCKNPSLSSQKRLTAVTASSSHDWSERSRARTSSHTRSHAL